MALTDKKPDSKDSKDKTSRKSEGMTLEGQPADKKERKTGDGHRDKHEHSSKSKPAGDAKTETTKADTKHHSKDKTDKQESKGISCLSFDLLFFVCFVVIFIIIIFKFIVLLSIVILFFFQWLIL
jgi:hypothetical protein